MAESLTVVTDCDRNYLWGAMLLIASLRSQKIKTPVHVLTLDFTPREQRYLDQFDNVRVFDMDGENPRNPCTRKGEALLTAETDYAAWFDADCLAVGDISRHWIPSNGSFQARFRSREEVDAFYFNHYLPGESRGTIPRKVLDVWRKDVGENETSAIESTCSTDNFVLHRRHFEFVHRWNRQLIKVLPPVNRGVVHKNSVAYRSTDESVLNSLLAFARNAPPCDGEYQLDKDPQAYVVHFVLSPKPWQRWLNRHLQHYDRVLDLVDWIRANGHATPPVPLSLQRRCRWLSRLYAMTHESMQQAKHPVRRLLRR